MPTSQRFVVVGVHPGQSTAVLDNAAQFARAVDAELVCAFVDADRYTIAQQADGSVISLPVDPEQADEATAEFDDDFKTWITDHLSNAGVSFSLRALAGGAADQLSTLAEELNAAMIVVGTREAGFKGSLQEFFNGSIAVQLSHRQTRPVVVVPMGGARVTDLHG